MIPGVTYSPLCTRNIIDSHICTYGANKGQNIAATCWQEIAGGLSNAHLQFGDFIYIYKKTAVICMKSDCIHDHIIQNNRKTT